MKTLFDNNERLTDEGTSLDREIHQVLLPIFKKWIKYGCRAREIEYRAREIEYIINMVSLDISLNELMQLNADKEQKET